MEWHTARTGNDQGLVIDESGNNIAVTYKSENANLVAAAPQMLEALRELARGFQDGSVKFAKRRQSDSDPYHKANILMNSAIAKAEGR